MPKVNKCLRKINNCVILIKNKKGGVHMNIKESTAFRRTLKQLMSERNITGVEIAELCGVSKVAVSGWLNGAYQPSGIKINKIASYFGVSVNYLIGKEETYVPPETIDTFEDARAFLKSLNILNRANLKTKSKDEWLALAITIHSILKMQGLV